MKINTRPGAPGNHATLPLSHRTLHLMQTTQLQRQPEQQHEEGGGSGGGDNGGGTGGDNGGGGGTGGGSQQQQQKPNPVTFSTEQTTEMNRLFDERIADQKRQWDQAAKDAKEQETQKAEHERLKQQGEFEKLAGTEKERADKAEREIAELKLDADRVKACQDADIDVKHASRLKGTNLAELTADAKEYAKSFLPKAPSLQQSGTQGGSASGGQQSSNGNNGGNNSAPNAGTNYATARYKLPAHLQKR